jgi:hypothetical protein
LHPTTGFEFRILKFKGRADQRIPSALKALRIEAQR